MLNIAHRGFKGKYPENTMLAFKKAIEIGADSIEFDVHLTKDGEVVIIHDELLDRTTDMNGLIKDYTLNDLTKANAANAYEGLNEHIPTLREYLEYIKDKDIITNIELKNSIIDYPGLEKKVYELIEKYQVKDNIIISSFNHNSLIKMKEIDDTIRCGVLESSRLYKPWDYVKDMSMDFFHPINFSVDRDLIDRCRDNRVLVNVRFGIADFDFREILRLNPNGVITDYPDRVKEILDRADI